MSTEVVSFEGVGFAYEMQPVLVDVSFTISAGESVSIIGPNGGGKTTLLRLMLGLLRPDNGKISVFGRPPEKAAHRIGYVPQYVHFDPKFPVDVMDVVLMGRLERKSRGFYSARDRSAAADALRTVGIAELASRPFSGLSGGQRQRVLIARALVSNEELLLLDEPTSNIDRSAEREIEHLIRDLGRTRTIVIVSHDLGVVTSITGSVLCVNGSVVRHHTSDLSGDMIRQLYSSEVALVDHAGCCEEGGVHE